MTIRTRLDKYRSPEHRQPPGMGVSIYMPSELVEELRQEADKANMDLSPYVVRILQGAEGECREVPPIIDAKQLSEGKRQVGLYIDASLHRWATEQAARDGVPIIKIYEDALTDLRWCIKQLALQQPEL